MKNRALVKSVLVQLLSCVGFFTTPWTAASRLPCPSPTLGACSNSCPLNWWCHPTISSSVIPFSSCLPSFPESGSFWMSQFFASGGQSIIGASTSVSAFPVNIQDWFPLRLTGLISLKSKGLSRIFSNTTVQKRQFFGTQLSLNWVRHPWWHSRRFSRTGYCSSNIDLIGNKVFGFLKFFQYTKRPWSLLMCRGWEPVLFVSEKWELVSNPDLPIGWCICVLCDLQKKGAQKIQTVTLLLSLCTYISYGSWIMSCTLTIYELALYNEFYTPFKKIFFHIYPTMPTIVP